MLTFKAIKCICKKFKLTCSTQRYCNNSGTNFSGTCENWLPWRIPTYSEDAEAAAEAAAEAGGRQWHVHVKVGQGGGAAAASESGRSCRNGKCQVKSS